MKKFFSILLIILGILVLSLGSLAIIGGAGWDSLILIIPGLLLLIPGIRMLSYVGNRKASYTAPNYPPYGQPTNTPYGQPANTPYGQPAPAATHYDLAPAPKPDTVPTCENPQPPMQYQPSTQDSANTSAVCKSVQPEEAIHYRAAMHPEVMSARNTFVALHIAPSGFSDDPAEAPRKAREIYAIRFVGGQVQEDFFLRINPEKPETNAQRDDRILYRMTPDDRYAAPGFTPQPMITEVSERNAFQKLMNFLGDDVTDGKVCLAGHGILAVDLPLLQVSLAKLGYHSRDMLHVIDVEEIAKQILQLPDYSLPALARYYNLPVPDFAEASKDPFLAGQVLLRMISMP